METVLPPERGSSGGQSASLSGAPECFEMCGEWQPRRGWKWANRLGRSGAVAFGLLWPLTMLGGVTLAGPGGLKVAMYGGSLNVQWMSVQSGQGLAVHTYTNAVGARWWLPSVESFNGVVSGTTLSTLQVILSLWIIALLAALVGGLGMWKCRPPLVGVCRSCRYDLSASPADLPCPECGHQRLASRNVTA